MNLYPNLTPWLIVAIFGGLMWFSWDMRSILHSGKQKNQLSLDGKWQELDQYFVRAERTCRPFVWLHHRYLLPGNLETQYALFLYKRGRLEEALAKVDQAIRRNMNKPVIFRSYHAKGTAATLRGALRTRTLILTGLGRYSEARAAAEELERLPGPAEKSAAKALLEYHCGHLDEALAEAQAVRAEDPQYDSMRGVVSYVYCMKGEFEKAIESLSYKPADAFKFYSQPGLEALTQTSVGVDLIALKRKRLARIFPPARLILLAHVYVAMEDFAKADGALDEAEKMLGPEPGLQMSYARHRACSLAGQGKSADAEKYIERMRALAKELPKRSALWESHAASGRAYLYLARYPEALSELLEAQRSALHPIEKHVNAFWIAKTHEAAGNQNGANDYFKMVAADGIPSRLREASVAALSRSQV